MATIHDVPLTAGANALLCANDGARPRTFVLKNMDSSNGFEIIDALAGAAGSGMPLGGGDERAVVLDAGEKLWGRALAGTPTVRVMRLNAATGG